jgi:putative ATPase
MEKSLTKILLPLAERMRPQTLEAFVGQEKLISEDGQISKFLKNNTCPSIIFWGNPGVGKTTLAYLISKSLDLPFYSISAISAGVKDIREVIERSDELGKILLFIDEIHRFNKSQQDALLKAVEEGKITLIGATTENPSFEVNRALLSRCKVYTLEDLTVDALKQIANQAITEDEILARKKIEIREWEALLVLSGGDARKLLNSIEIICQSVTESKIVVDNQLVKKLMPDQLMVYDKNGEYHYDVISAFIKSLRGSDPNAALYWLVKMIDSGENPKFIARRMIVFASEDIGMANANALLLANTCFESVTKIGYPESSIILSHTVVYLATSAKSNASYLALKKAQKSLKESGNVPVPMHLRNAPTKLMKDLNYGGEYRYPHDFEGNFVHQQYLPDALKDTVYYEPGINPRELEIKAWLKKWWPKKYK